MDFYWIKIEIDWGLKESYCHSHIQVYIDSFQAKSRLR